MAQIVVIETSMGAVTLELYTSHAPKTCQNFTTLASRNYYNGTIFHRLIPDFMIQGGDPTGNYADFRQFDSRLEPSDI